MKTKLMPTQVEDIAKIVAGNDIPNFSEPGTGKTLTTIGAIEEMKLQSGLVVCPTVATIMWTRLLAQELGARVQHLRTGKMEIDKKADFLVVSYGTVSAQKPMLMRRNNDALIIDESHYIKNYDAIRTQAILGRLSTGEGGIYETCLQCWMLTGTPIERYADDLWTQLRATHPDVLQRYKCLSLDNFRLQFCQMEHKTYGKDRQVTRYVSTGNQNERLLNRILYEDIGAIRRTMDEVDPFMPPTTERYVHVNLDISSSLMSLVKGKTKAELTEAVMKGEVYAATARRMMGVGKVRSALDYIKEQARMHPVLVGFWHQEVGTETYLALYKSSYAVDYISGATTPAARERIREKFMAGEIDVLVGQIQAMGIAMDGLQEVCSHVILLENDWSHAKVEQFYKRVARKGQQKHTQVDFLQCDLALEEVINDIRTSKKEGAKVILDVTET